MLGEGRSVKEIAIELGRSQEAVSGRAWKIGLKKRSVAAAGVSASSGVLRAPLKAGLGRKRTLAIVAGSQSETQNGKEIKHF